MFSSLLPNGLGLRPMRSTDAGFVESLYRTTRNDLRLIDAESGFVDHLIDMQYQAQTQGYGDMFPNAMHMLVEHHGQSIGRVIIDFGHNEIRIVDIAFIPQARGKGHGRELLKGILQAARSARAPVALTVDRANLTARQLYLSLGFQVQETTPSHEYMLWYPCK